MTRRNVILLVYLLFIAVQLPAQKAKYAEIAGAYDARIPEHTGNTIHIWTASAEQVRGDYTKTTLTLHVFSSDMQVLAETKVPLGRIKNWNLDFKYTSSGYYAHIFYISDANNRLILNVDFSGNMNDVSNTYGPWKKMGDTLTQANKIFALLNTGNKLYVTKTENTDSLSSSDVSNIMSVDGTKMESGKKIQQLFVRKVIIRNQQTTQQLYGSAALHFSYPLLNVTDTGIVVFAFAEQEPKDDRSKTPLRSFIFLSRLDTSLRGAGKNFACIQIAGKPASEKYAPLVVFSLNNKLFLINNGWNALENRSPALFSPFGVTNFSLSSFSQIHSFRIIGIDEKNELFRDTLIENQSGGGRINWQNYFLTASDKSIDFFLSSRYRGSKNGISHLRIDGNGNMTEEDLIVDVRHEYLLSKAKRLDADVLVVPFEKRGKVAGVMRLLIKSADPLQ